jgi:predicted alpha/beta-hydrolase family hydrolase
VKSLVVPDPDGDLDAVLQAPPAARAALVLAHGAGAGYRHATMESLASAFAEEGLATLRFNFPYMQAGRRRVDSQQKSVAAIKAAAEVAKAHTGLPLYLGGHSFGGRMASHAVVDLNLSVRGLIFCSFPLHPARKPATKRALHLPLIEAPMLFLSGTRDALAESALLEATVSELGDRAQLHYLETADHSYRILKRQRPPGPDVFSEMATVAGGFVARTLD